MSKIYSPLKALHYGDRLEAIRGGGVPAPVHVRIKPTNVCNHDCYYCAYRTPNLALGEDMVVRDRIPWEKMREITDDIIDMDVKAVTFSGGGDPLVYPYLAETVAILGKADVAVGCLTNGARLSGANADALAEHGTWVRVSIDGWDGSSYAKYRNVGDDEFFKVMANMRQFSARRSACVLGASIIVDETNAPHIFDLARLLCEAGVAHVKVSPVIIANEAQANADYHQRLMAVVRGQLDMCRQLESDTFTMVNHFHPLDETFDNSYRTCPTSRVLTIIGADCEVYACHDKAYTEGGKLGSIAERSFKEFWFSRENRERLAAINPSRDCLHHCAAAAQNRLLLDYMNLDRGHIAFM